MSPFKNEVNHYLVLNEGIVLFKNSRRMFKLSAKLRSVEEIDHSVSDKILSIAKSMEYLETQYTTSKDKKEINRRYRQLNLKYYQLIEMLDDERLLNSLKAVGGLAATVLAALGGYYFIATNNDLVLMEVKNKFNTPQPIIDMMKDATKDTKIDYVKKLKDMGSGLKRVGYMPPSVSNGILSAGENLGNIAKVTAAISSSATIGLMAVVKAFHSLLGFKKAKRLKIYNKTAAFLNKVEKLV